MSTIAGLFSPPLLAALSIATLGIGVVLFIVARRSDDLSIDYGTPLSWAEPVELRLVLYFLIGAISGTIALVLRLVFGTLSDPSFLGWMLLSATVLMLLGNLAFIYAGAGTLLQAAMGTRGRPPFWFFSLLSVLDGAVMDVGDFVSGVLFRPAPEQQRRPRRRHTYDDDYAYEYEEERQPPRRPSTPSRQRQPAQYQYEDESDSAYAQPAPARPAAPTARRPRPPYVHEDDVPAEVNGSEPPRRAVPHQRTEPPHVVSQPDEYNDGPRRGFGTEATDHPTRAPLQYERDATSNDEPGRHILDDYQLADDATWEEEAPRRSMRRVRKGEPRDIPRERLDMAIRQYEAALTPPQRERLREMRSLIESILHQA